jgi:hypothetical protein
MSSVHEPLMPPADPDLGALAPSEAGTESVASASELEYRSTPRSPSAAPEPRAVPIVDFPAERPALEHLSSGAVRAEWERRADWLEAMANSADDPAARGRWLLAASEIRALLGAQADSRRLAERAANLAAAPALVARQTRGQQFAEGDHKAVLRGLIEETRAARTPALRAHGHYVAAELQRLVLHDENEIEQRLEAAEQSDASDHRATLQRLARQLARQTRPPDVRFRADENLRPLRHATGQLRQLRGSEAPRLGAPDLSAQPLVEAQRAIARGRWAEAADALGALSSQPGLRSAVRWLSVLWRVLPRGQQDEILSSLAQLAREHPGRTERRVLAARALACGDAELVKLALSDWEPIASSEPHEPPDGVSSAAPDSRSRADAAPEAFSALERAALRALAGWPKALAGSPSPAALEAPPNPAEDLALSALESAGARLGGPSPSRARTTSLAELEFAFGRALAGHKQFSDSAPLLAALAHSPWVVPIRLEQSRQTRELAALAAVLPRWAGREREDEASEFIAGVFAERAGDESKALEHYQRAITVPGLSEAALRALGRRLPDQASRLCSLAARTSDGTRRALLLIEALCQLSPQAPDFNAWAEAAWRADPQLPIGMALGELGARMRADRFELGRWLARRREAAASPGERLLEAVREARFLALEDRELAARRLREVTASETTDLALEQELERLAPGPLAARAQWRLSSSALVSARRRNHLLAEAAALFRSAGDLPAALAAARAVEGPLALLHLIAWANSVEDRAGVSARLKKELAALPEDDVSWELYIRCVRSDPALRDDERSRRIEQRLLDTSAGASFLGLRWFEIESMALGRDSDLERSSARWFAVLRGRDIRAHAYLAARLAIDRGAFAEAAQFGARVAELRRAPLWALRLSQAAARAYHDNRQLFICCRELSERAAQPLDAATLALRAAEAALLLGDLEGATREVQRAFEIAPDQIAILAARAELLRRHGRYAEAAEAFETLAAATESPARRAEAAFQAASIWLDVLEDRQHGLAALEHAATLEPAHPGARQRWNALCEADAPPPPRTPEPPAPTAAELVRDNPDDLAARRRWIGELVQAGQLSEALEQQREIVTRCQGDDERRESLLELAALLQLLPDGSAEAAALLERAQRTWPEHPRVLAAQVDHERRSGNAAAARALLERAILGARSAALAGRLDPELFELLEIACRLNADPDGARLARAVLAGLAGHELQLGGAGSRAGHPRFDDVIAPALLSSGFRRLLYAAGAALERAYAVEPRSIAMTPLPEPQVARVRAIAAAFGLPDVRAAVAPDLGSDCVTLFAEPRWVVFGEALLAHEDPRLRDFCLLRALKLAQLNAAALCRLPPSELWAALAGFFACFAPAWDAEGADAQRLITARNRIRPHITAQLEPELMALTSALATHLMPQAADLGDALMCWASRVGLFGVGDFSVALAGLWHIERAGLLPPRDREGRTHWIAASPAARDLVGYGISEAYIEARRRAGLITSST